MLDKDITPDDYEECPKCGGAVSGFGCKLDGHKKCDNEDCDFEDSWDYV